MVVKGAPNRRAERQVIALGWRVRHDIMTGWVGILPTGGMEWKMRFPEDVESALLNGHYDEEAYRGLQASGERRAYELFPKDEGIKFLFWGGSSPSD